MRRGVFDDVLYAQCWEDPRIDRDAFRAGARDVVFTITSGGCNALAFLLDDPRRVVALDQNGSQSHVLALKMAALEALAYDDLLAFVGARPSEERLRLYRAVRPVLGADARAFWDARREVLRRGLLHAGRYEGYLALLRTWVVRVVGRRVIDALFEAEDEEARTRLYHRYWNTRRWRLLTDLLLSRRVMTLLFDKAFFAQIEARESFGANFRARVEYALTRLPVRENPFLSYILRGRFDDAQLPTWLRPEHHERIRARLDRIEIVSASCLDWMREQPDASISRFNFSNIFEWLPRDLCKALLTETTRVATDGAVLAYRNLLVPRRRPASLRDRIETHEALAGVLHARDLSFIYRRYVVETVRKGVPCAV